MQNIDGVLTTKGCNTTSIHKYINTLNTKNIIYILYLHFIITNKDTFEYKYQEKPCD